MQSWIRSSKTRRASAIKQFGIFILMKTFKAIFNKRDTFFPQTINELFLKSNANVQKVRSCHYNHRHHKHSLYIWAQHITTLQSTNDLRTNNNNNNSNNNYNNIVINCHNQIIRSKRQRCIFHCISHSCFWIQCTPKRTTAVGVAVVGLLLGPVPSTHQEIPESCSEWSRNAQTVKNATSAAAARPLPTAMHPTTRCSDRRLASPHRAGYRTEAQHCSCKFIE